MNKLTKTVLALALAAVSLQASAHRGWLLPQSTNVEGKEAWVTIDGAISEGLFDVDHVALKLDDATVTGPDGATVRMPLPVMGKQRSSFDLKMEKDGTYKITLISKAVMGSYKDKATGEIKRFRGTEESFAKDVLSRRAGRQDGAHLRPPRDFCDGQYANHGRPQADRVRPRNGAGHPSDRPARRQKRPSGASSWTAKRCRSSHSA
ncbi:DUF4198 domain-containing protein [Massilia sp. B-10]|nr:DUF4198 domain-containing protein [Massilia sp. B-10]